MTAQVAVVGGGAAGVAAAWAARRGGADVTLYQQRAGATELASGTADLVPWSSLPLPAGSRSRPRARPLQAVEDTFLRELDYWRVGSGPVATSAGVIRPCTACDPALLDLGPLAGKVVAVATVERDDWDGAVLARTLESSPWAQTTRTRFRAVPLALLEQGVERRIPPADFALLHDDAGRRARLAERLGSLRAAQPEVAALLVGPWLGVEPAAQQTLQQALGLPLGECTSWPGGVSGLRFARARSLLLAKLGVEVREQQVLSVERRGERWQLTALADHGRATAEFSHVVLAVGGLVSGGVEFTPRQEFGSAFRLGLEAPVQYSITGEPLELVSSSYGFDPVTLEGAWIDRAGVLVDEEGQAGAGGLFAAGDVVAGTPRTVLEAVRQGIGAGDAIAAE